MSTGWFDLTGRTAVVTGGGANGGNGHAIAIAFAKHGANVFIGDIDEAGASETAKQIAALGRKSGSRACDNGEPDDIAALFAAVDAEIGTVDILVNNVGVGYRSRPERLSLADWQRVCHVNLDGMFLCSQEAGRRMIASGKGGSIINISSIAGSSALGRGNFVYSVTKGGVNQFTRELAIEWAPHGIRVNAIQPAQIMTPAMERMFADPQLDPASLMTRLLRGIPRNRLGVPEDVAKAAVFLASDAADFISGHMLPVDGGNLAMNAGGDKLWPTDL